MINILYNEGIRDFEDMNSENILRFDFLYDADVFDRRINI